MPFPDLSETLLSSRGISPEDRADFLKPDYKKLHDPMLMPDMEKARDRVIDAMKKGGHITVYSDYDADGIPGAAVMADFFRRANYEQVSFYIPHRHDEGFGLNMDAIEAIKERGTKLLITVDCGVADTKEVARAQSLGMDVIITDHHLPNEELPPAYAIVNPNLKDSAYPFKGLCGSAVAWKLVLAILAKDRFGIPEGMEKWSLDMVGIATLSDMVPLVGENRILAKFGLDVLRKSQRLGLDALLGSLRIDPTYLTEDDIAFMITPRINAASRMGVPMDAFNLLSATSRLEAARLAAHLEKINQERKGAVAAMVKDAKKHLEAREKMNSVIVIGNPEWRPALCGLVANSLVEAYDRPVFVWGRDGDGVIKGSCRSDGTDLFLLMNRAVESFIEFGGHSGAGGFSVETDKIHRLEEVLSEAYEAMHTSPPTPLLDERRGEHAHIPLGIHEVSEDLWRVVSSFAPFGTGNEKPVFSFQNAEIRSAKQFGKAKEHLEVIFDAGLPRAGRGVKAVSFFSAPDSYKVTLSSGSKVTLLATLEKSYFMSRPEIRLRIVDII